MAQKRYSQQDIEKFLKVLDAHLKKSFDMVIIGGAAAALAYRAVKYTVDIDTTNSIAEIAQAYKEAKEETGLEIHLGPAGVFDAPHNYEERLQPLQTLSLTKLNIFIPEVHDLILMKVVRGDAHDIEQIKEIQKKQSIDLNILIRRFIDEMKHVIGNPRTLQLNFLAMVAETFGEEKADKIELLLGKMKKK